MQSKYSIEQRTHSEGHIQFLPHMAYQPPPMLDLVISLLQTLFPEMISEHSFTAVFTLLDMRP